MAQIRARISQKAQILLIIYIVMSEASVHL